MNEKSLPLNSLHLKLLAMVTMLIDHMGFTLFPYALWMRCVGRLAFPVFCFLIAEGCAHTHDKKRYAARLLVFAVLSEPAFDLMHGVWFTMDYQNVLWTLLLGALVCWAVEWASAGGALWPRSPCGNCRADRAGSRIIWGSGTTGRAADGRSCTEKRPRRDWAWTCTRPRPPGYRRPRTP